MLNDCLFCAIAAGEIPSTQVHADDRVIAFRDIAPRAPTHVLVVPRAHITSAAALTDEDAELTGHVLAVAASIARAEGIAEACKTISLMNMRELTFMILSIG